MMNLSTNSFEQGPKVAGQIGLSKNFNTIEALVDASVTDANALVTGQLVEDTGADTPIPSVQGLTADDGNFFGVVQYNKKNRDHKAQYPLGISRNGNCVYLIANEAIAQGTNVSPIVSMKSRIVKGHPAKAHVGWAYDAATSAGQLIRIMLGERTRYEQPGTPGKGDLDVDFQANLLKVVAGGALAPGDSVEVTNSATTLPTVTKANATDDNILGVVINLGVAAYAADDELYIARNGTVVHMLANAAIARGASVMTTTAGANNVVTATANNTIVGIALDQAAAAGDLLRVTIDARNNEA